MKGADAEARAAAHLEALGREIVARNYRLPGGEIDLVSRDAGGVSCPRKYGLNGAIPAMVNSTVASWLISEAEGTTV